MLERRNNVCYNYTPADKTRYMNSTVQNQKKKISLA